MKLIRQPEGSSLCGQACVAMAAGVSLNKACKVFGHEKATFTRDVIDALRILGVDCADRLHIVSRKRPILPKRCLVMFHRPDTSPERRHWALSWDGKIYDPDGDDGPVKNWRITSYLEIF